MQSPSIWRRRAVVLAALGVTLARVDQASAVNRSWQTVAGGTWTTGGNWNPSATPASGDNLLLYLDTTYPITLGSAVGSMVSATNGTVTLSAGTLTTGGLATIDDPAAVGLSDGAQLTLDAARWINTSNEVMIGSVGFGQLSVINAASFSHGGLRLGSATTGSGMMSASGTNTIIGRINTTNAGTIGVSGAGTVSVLAGARMNNSGVTLGQLVSGKGYALVSGLGSLWQIGMNSSSLTVGQSGSGTLQVTSGGVVRISNTDAGGNTQQPVTANQLIVGGLAGSTGVVMLDGPGTQLYVGNTSEVGDNGLGFATITNGASWTLGDKLSIGVHTTAFGTIGVDGIGSNIQVTNDLLVGRDEGSGSLLITNGGLITGTGVNKIGWNARANGYANVDGPGSRWVAQDFWVADAGHGTLLISNGGTISANNGMVGAQGGAVGVATLGGLGGGSPARWAISGTLAIAGSGTVTVNQDGQIDVNTIKVWNAGTLVLNGGTINTASIILNAASSKFNFAGGTFRYTGNRTLNASALSSVLGSGTPTIGVGQHLAVENAGTVGSSLRLNGGTLSLGITNSFIATNLIFDSGTLNLTASSLTIGGGGIFGTTASFSSGKAVNTPQTTVSSSGTLTLGGGFLSGGTILNSGTIIITGGTLNAGTGGLAHSGRLTLNNANINGPVTLSVTNLSTVNVNAAESRFNGAVTGVAAFTGTGKTRFNGSYGTGLVPGNIAFAGDVTFGATNTLRIKVGGHTPGTQHDRLNISGQLDAGGSLSVSLINAFSPLPGETFDIITFGSHSAGDFNVINDPAKPALMFSTLFDSGKMQLVTGALHNGDANLDAVVDIKDLMALALHYQQSGNWLAGDFDGNGFVDIADLTVLASNWQAGTAAPAVPLSAALASLGLPQVSVPEPASAMMMAAAVALLRRRRKSCE